MGSLWKGINNLVGASNYLAWNKRIDLILTEQEVMEYVTREIINPSKDKTQEVGKVQERGNKDSKDHN